MSEFKARRSLRTVALVAAATALSGCRGGVLDAQGPVGADDSAILIDALLIMLVIVVPTILLAFGIAWRYRASNTKASYLPEWSYSGRIEAVVWAIPILVILFIGGVIWIGSYRLDPFRPLSKTPPLEVQVVALDWKWLFIYPQQQIATVNQLVIPAGVPVRFSITSASVFNTFFIPRLGSMIYAMPGMTSQLNLQADQPATLLGESAHFSGDGFSDMNFEVRSVPAASFAGWSADMRKSGQTLDRGTYALLARQSHNVKPYGYKAIDPALFADIASQKIAPAPGPEPENPGHAGQEASNAGRP
ncbi:MAG TPA: ubiquinol oxidase subunit II [Rhizomicrobium sp.]|nr:ubiquinol oxidase subunit II [Rhizomicrobium sp.]